MEFLVASLLVLAAVTLVGHGVWVFVSWLYRAARRPADPRPPAALEALAAEIDRLGRLGILDEAACRRLRQSLVDERARMLAAAATASSGTAVPAEEFVAAEVVPERELSPPPKAEAPAVPELRELASDASVHHRAAAYQAGRRTAPEPLPEKPAPPARSWTDWLAAFMEERNIRWGELVGGLLIVGCSIALVVSFWSAIDERPWLKFLLFGGVTAALFGVGFYSEHRWRLRTTSQGLLTIGCLLVPLNFLAIAAFSSAPAGAGPATLAGELISAAVFAALVFYAAKTLVPRDEIGLTLGLLIPSLAQLLVRRFVDPATATATLAAVTAVPVACYLAVNYGSLGRLTSGPAADEARVNSVFKFLGITSFAAVLPLALALYRTGNPLEALRQLPGLVGLLGLVPLGAGLALWRKLAGLSSLVALRTAGTAVAVAGAVVSLAGVVVAWPEPGAMLPVALVEFVVFTFVAWRFRLSAAHLAAAPCLALAYLLGAYLVGGKLELTGIGAERLASVLVSGETGMLLAPLVVGYLAAAFLLGRRSSPAVLPLFAAAGVLAAASTALAGWFGFGLAGDPLGAGWVYLLYAACSFAVSARHRHPAFAWIGAALLLAGVVQEVVFGYAETLGLVQPAVTAILVFSSLTALVAFGARRLRATVDDSPLVDVAWYASFFVSLVAAGRLVWLVGPAGVSFEALGWAWLAALWLAAALATGWLPVWTLFQTALVLATVLGTGAFLERFAWFAESPRPWLDPWSLQAVALALIGLNLFWAAARIVSSRYVRARRLLASPWLSVDRATTVALVVLLVAIGLYAAAPGVLQELSPRDAIAGTTVATTPSGRTVLPVERFEPFGIPHAHAADGWFLLAGLLVLLAVMLRERISAAWLACLFVVAAVASPLAAARFEGQVAVASALRFSSALLLGAGSISIWARGPLARRAERWGWQTLRGHPSALGNMTALVFVLALLAPALLAATTALAALPRSGQLVPLARDALFPTMVSGAAALAAVVLWIGFARRRRARSAAALLMVLGAAPLLSIIAYHVAIALRVSPIVGPEPGSIFARMGLAASYGAPLLLVALALVGFALRERSSRFGLAGGLTLCAAASVAFLLAMATARQALDAVAWLRLAQLNAAVAAIYTLAWFAVAAWRGRRRDAREPLTLDLPTATQTMLAPALAALALGWAWIRLVRFPEATAGWLPVVPELTDLWGWLSFAVVCASIGALSLVTRRAPGMLTNSAVLVGLAIFAAGVAARWDTGNWLAYNTLGVGHAVIAAGLLTAAWIAARGRRGEEDADVAGGKLAARSGAVWIVLQAVAIVLLAVREVPANEWWSVGGFALVGMALAPGLAWVYQRRRYLYLAAPLVNVAVTLAFSRLNLIPDDREFFLWNVVLFALPAPAWLAIEWRRIRGRRFTPLVEAPPLHRVAARLALAALAVGTGVSLFADWMGNYQPAPFLALDWLALAAVLVAVLACLWDVKGRDSVAMLYTLGLVACAVLLDGFNLARPWLLWTGTLVLASFVLATSYLWSRRRGLLSVAQALRIPRPPQTELAGLSWLVPANVALVAAVVLMTVAVELSNTQTALRVLAAQATLVQAASLALLARGDHRGLLQLGALKLGAVGAAMFGWAWLEVGTSLTWLHALVVVAAAAAGTAALYGLGLSKLLRETSDWLAPARRITPPLAAASAAAVAAVLGIEIYQFARFGEVAIAWPAILVVALTLAALAAAALAAAVLPGRDPLGLSQRGRTLYVYAAEVILALLFVHVRVTLPWLFAGFFEQFWPLVVMAIAYLGVGFSELFRRRGQRVLAEPLQNTGALLPVLPVAGYWATGSNVDYSLVLLCVGVLYAGLSIARRSFGFGLLAALAANGGLWFFLGRQDGLGFLAHPQVWLIPPALCVLAAAYLNRPQLSETQMTAIRYFTSMAVYLSSTADIFVNGVGQAPWLPLVLAGLSVAGILAGILLRVRAFLFLGTSFLGLALFTIIWYAAVDRHQTWIWWASGVILGILILATFALFEKKRRDVLEVFERLKQWEA